MFTGGIIGRYVEKIKQQLPAFRPFRLFLNAIIQSLVMIVPGTGDHG
jgi:hypothetical protein